MNEKVYEVTVRLRVYGDTSKGNAINYLYQALHIEGVTIVGEIEKKDLAIAKGTGE
jgi:hypothetical protein